MNVDKKGKEIFLECNPSGQWYFHEEVGMQISQAIAKILIGEHTMVKKSHCN